MASVSPRAAARLGGRQRGPAHSYTTPCDYIFCRAGERPHGAAAVSWRHCGLIAVHQALLWASPAPGGARSCSGVRDPAPGPAVRAGRGVLVPEQVVGPAHGHPAVLVAVVARAPPRALLVPLCCRHCFILLCFHTIYFVPTPCDRLHVAPSLTGRALCRDIATSVHLRGAHPSPTLPRSVVLPSIVIAQLWLVTAQFIEFAAHRPDYGRFFVVHESIHRPDYGGFFVIHESMGTWRECRWEA